MNEENKTEKPLIDDEVNVFVQDHIIIKFVDTDEIITQKRG